MMSANRLKTDGAASDFFSAAPFFHFKLSK